MRFSLILAGMIFLFSPDIMMLDLLPDVFGWALIVFGITPLADIDIRADEAKSLSKRMMLFSGAKLALSLLFLSAKRIDMLLMCFSYAILEMITVIPFCEKLTKSLDYTSMRVGAPLDSDKLNVSKWYMYAFFGVKNLLSVLPSIPALFDYESTGEYKASSWYIDFDALMNFMTVFAFFFAIVLSVVVLVYFIPFWTRLIKNRELNEKMCDSRRVNVLEVPKRMILKNTAFAFAFFAPATVFMFDFYIDFVEILPTFVGFAFVFVGSVFIRKRMGHKVMPLTVTSALGTVVSLVTFLYRVIPLAENKFVMDYGFSERTLTLPFAGLNSLLIILTFVFLFREAGNFNERYTKYKLSNNRLLYMIGGAVLSVFDFLLYVYPEKNTVFVFPSLIFGSAFCAMSAYYFVILGKQIKFDNKEY